MRNALTHRIAVVAVVSLAACSGNGSQLAPASGNGVDHGTESRGDHGAAVASSIFAGNSGAIRKPTEPFLSSMRISPGSNEASGDFVPRAAAYVSEFFGAWVSQYLKNNVGNSGPLCRISVPASGVNGIGVDFSNNLWVPLGTGTGTGYTTEYAPNCGTSKLTIADTDGQPANVVFGPGGGVYIENITGVGGEGTGSSIDVYPPGATSPSAVLTEPKALFGIGEALDSQANVYMSWVDGHGAGHVDEFIGGQNPASTLAVSAGFVGGITFDKKRHLMLVDQTAGAIVVYAPPYTTSSIATISLVGASVACKLDHLETHLYCADYRNGAIDVYAYNSSTPSATSYKYSWTNGIDPTLETSGVAIAAPSPN